MNLFKNKQTKFVAISFEEGLAKIAYVILQEGHFVLQNTVTLENHEFDNFLKTTKENEFIVVSTFQVFYQAVLSLPPAQDKYLRTLSEIEVRKNYTEVKDFSFFYDVLGETQHEGKKVKDTFVFAVDYEEIHSIIERFSKYNKTIVALYPSVLTLPTLFSSIDSSLNEILLCVLDTGNNKTLFLLKDGKPCFVRVTQSGRPGIDAPDIDNINMTINYFRQTLRLSPSKVIFIGTTGHKYGSVPDLVVPAMGLEYPSNVIDQTESIAECIIPLSAVLSYKDILWGNLLPPAYQTLKTQKTVLFWSTLLLLLFSFIGAGYTALTVSEIPDLKAKINSARKEIAEKQPILKEYGSINSELQKIMPLITYMNKAIASPDTQQVLAAFNFLPMQNIRINSIQINSPDSKLTIRLQGIVLANNFTDMDTSYRKLIDTIKSTKSLEITTQSIDIKEMNFVIEIKWKI